MSLTNSRSLWVAALASLTLVACQESTQVTFNITTDIPCDRLNGVAITVGLDGQTENTDPREVIRECRFDGTVGIIGTYALVPKADKTVTASIKLAAAVGSDVDVTTDCTAENKYKGCVVARRQVSFVRNRSLVVPVELYLVCKSIACDDVSTCNRAGRCVTTRVDVSKCETDGTCSQFVTKPGEGLPCFNDGAAEPLFCVGDTGWCSRDSTGMRSCSETPGTTGVSFECREDKDCGTGLECASGENGILGHCELITVATTPPTIQTVTITDASPTSHTSLSLTYTGIGGSIDQYCILENSSVVRLCQWVSSSMPPAQYTPALANGPLVLSVFLKGRSGQLSSVGISNSVVIDRLAPTATWVAPAGGELWPNDSTQNLMWSATDNDEFTATPVTLEVSSDDGATFTALGGAVPNMTWGWMVGVYNSAKMRLRLTVTDAAGNQTRVVSARFTVGTPDLAIDSLSVNQGQTTTNNPALNLTWGFVSGRFTKYCININDTLQASCSWVAATALPATLTVAVADGPIVLTAWVQGADGTTSPAVTSQSIVLDQTAPSAAWVSPAGSEVWDANTHDLTWTASDALGLASLPVVIDLSTDNGATFTALVPARSNTPSTYSWQPAVTATQVKLRLTVTDAAGNTARAISNAFSVDSVGPTLASLSVNGGATGATSGTLNLSWGATTDSFNSYCINVNDTVLANCVWTSGSTLPATFAITGADGAKTLSAWLRDAAGNVSAPVTSNTITVDRVAPMASWVAPAGGEVWLAGLHTLSWSASDNLSLAANPIVLEVSSDNGATFSAITPARSNTPANFAWQVTALNSNQVKLRLSVSDAVGNVTRVVSNTLTIDTVGPTLASLQLNSGATATNNATLNLTWGSITDTFAAYCVNLNDTDVANCLWTTGTTLPATYAVGGADGTKTLTAWLRDAAGNVSTAVTSNAISLDRVAPAASWASPTTAVTMPVGTPTIISWTATDTAPGTLGATPIAIEVSTNNGTTFAPLVGPIANSPASYSWIPSGINSTQVKLRLTVTDAAGNTVQATTPTFTVTPVAPTLASLQVNAGALATNSTTLNLTWGASNNTFNRYCINLNDTNVANCAWVTSFTLPTTRSIPAGDGFKTLSAWVQNSVGATSATVTANTIALDQTPPVATLVAPVDGELWSSNNANQIRWTASDTRVLATTPILLERSLDSGGTFTALSAPLTNLPSTFTWTEPTLTSTQVKVRLTVTDAAGNTTVVTTAPISLTPLVWSPNPKDYGSINVFTISDQPVFTLTNTDVAAVSTCAAPTLSNLADFQIVADTCGTNVLAPGGSCTVKIRANPQATGVRAGTLSRNCGAAGTATAPLTVTGTGTFPVRWSVNSLDLTEVNLTKSSTTNDVYFQNVGTTISPTCTAVSLTNTTDFTVVSDGCAATTLAAGDMCRVQVKANPQSIGTKSASLSRTCGGVAKAIALSTVGTAAYPTQISGGALVTCARMSDGTARCWGSNIYGNLGAGAVADSAVPIAVTGLTNVVSVSSGGLVTCALLADTTVKCWGENSSGMLGFTGSNSSVPIAVPGLTGVTSVTVGGNSVCALMTDQTVKCWGRGIEGQLGDGTNQNRAAPAPVTGLTSVKSLAVGDFHACAVLTDDTMKCWGDNSGGGLGVPGGAAGSSNLPVVVPGVTGVVGASASTFGTCAWLTNQTAKCWGINNYGQNGWGATAGPAVFGLSNVVSMQGGYRYASTTCALLATGTVQCFGANDIGQVGDGNFILRTAPTPVAGVTGAVAVTGSGNHEFCVMRADHSVSCWGGGAGFKTVPFQHPTLTGVSAMSTSSDATCALMSNGSAQCWGRVTYGGLGDGTAVSRTTPAPVTLANPIADVQAGSDFACARLVDTTVRCWGYRIRAGAGSASANLLPIEPLNLGQTLSLSVGNYHACAVTVDGSLYCWGDNYYGVLGDGTQTSRSVPTKVIGISGAVQVAAGSIHTCVLMANGTVSCWGRLTTNGVTETNAPAEFTTPVAIAGLSNAVAIAAGLQMSCALLPDQTVSCWGDIAGVGRTLTPTPIAALSGVTSLALASSSSCALLSDQTVKCWGINAFGLPGNSLGTLGNGTTTTVFAPTIVPGLAGVTSLRGGPASQSMCAVRSGVPWCWGDNRNVQLGDQQGFVRSISGL